MSSYEQQQQQQLQHQDMILLRPLSGLHFNTQISPCSSSTFLRSIPHMHPLLRSSSPPPSSSSLPSSPFRSTRNKENRSLNFSPQPQKRAKPAKLSIPDHARLASFSKSQQFQAFADQATSTSDTHCHDSPLFGLAAKKGMKSSMEDSFTALPNFQGNPNQAFFGVFDGHGGKDAAKFAAEKLADNIAMAISKGTNLEDAMVTAYSNTDSEFLAKGVSSGACSVSALVTKGQLVVANAGDCRAVVCINGKATSLTTSHRASNEDERRRVQDLGGFVDCFNGVWRVEGVLAVTRGFGDKNLKQWISAEPEVKKMKITSDCEFLILASDGLWDKMNDQEAIDCVREVLLGSSNSSTKQHSSTPVPTQHHCDTQFLSDQDKDGKSKLTACNLLIQRACSRGNLDDITVIIVPLQSFSAC